MILITRNCSRIQEMIREPANPCRGTLLLAALLPSRSERTAFPELAGRNQQRTNLEVECRDMTSMSPMRLKTTAG